MVVRRITAAVGIFAITACYSVRPVANARDFISAEQPKRVWVVNSQNESYVLTSPRVEGDNIVGNLQGSGTAMTIPLGSAQLVEARQRDKTKTLVAGVVFGVVAGGVAFLVAGAGSTPGDSQTYTGDMSRSR
jgi:hypothetical protein